jgi:branched-chain amino acid transport system substrate-binding protein
MYLMQVKTPAESKGEWDYLKRVQTLKGEDIFTTQAESRCKLWK